MPQLLVFLQKFGSNAFLKWLQYKSNPIITCAKMLTGLLQSPNV